MTNTDPTSLIRETLLLLGPQEERTILATVGLPASGKSSWARQMQAKWPSFKILNKDQLRAMLDSGQYSPANEQFIRRVRLDILRTILTDGFSAIVDDTNLNPSARIELIELAAELSAAYVEVPFTDIPFEECVARDSQRTGSACVGVGAIRRMHEMYLRPNEESK